MQSKAESDRWARTLDAPVTLTYPTMVVGPDDPSLGEGMDTIARVLRGQVPAMPPGGMEIIDVRDLAAIRLMQRKCVTVKDAAKETWKLVVRVRR